jgi:fructokinase
MTGSRLRIGIDLGGTKIAGIAMAADGSVVTKDRVATPREDYEGSLEAIAALVARLGGACRTAASVGVGIPGSISPATGLAQNGNSVWLNGRPLGTDLERRLGRPVRLANDADCFTLSEAFDGAARDARTVFGVIIGTGCGGGIVVDNRLVTGPHNTGGEWGHMPLPWPREEETDGPDCWCGRRSCMETWVSGPALARDHARVTGKTLSPPQIVAAAGTGEPGAAATIARHGDRLARGLAVIVNLIDPDVIVLGGGLSNLSHLYQVLPGLMEPHIFADACRITIRPPVHGDASGVRGAARLWPARADAGR